MTAVRTYVDRVVATAPPLTADQRERLTSALRPFMRSDLIAKQHARDRPPARGGARAVTARENGAAPLAGNDAVMTESPAESTDSSVFYSDAERAHRADLAVYYESADPVDWPKDKRPGSPYFVHRVDQIAAQLHQDAADRLAEPLPLAEPADRLPSDIEAPLLMVEIAGRGSESRVVGADDQLFRPDQRIETAIPQRLTEAADRHDRHRGYREAHCIECDLQHQLMRTPDLDRSYLRASAKTAAESRVRAFLLAGGRFAASHDIRPPAPAIETSSRIVSGSAFPAETEDEAVELRGDLMLSGEALLLVGPPGVGKSTVAQQLVAAAIADDPRNLLGQAFAAFDKVVYLAKDRPRQIARSFRRIMAGVDPALLDERLVVWQGPPRPTWPRTPTPCSIWSTSASVGCSVTGGSWSSWTL